MRLDVANLPHVFDAWRSRQIERDGRHEIIDKIVAGEFDVFDPEEERVKSYSPNMIQVALEDTAEAAALVPTVRCMPTKPGVAEKERASQQERIAAGYMDANEIDLLIPRLIMDAAAYGLSALTITPDYEQRIPLIERRDPRTCYTEDGYRPGDTVRRAFFARALYFSQLPDEWRNKIHDQLTIDGVRVAGTEGWHTVDDIKANAQVVLVEWYDTDEVVIAALYQTGSVGSDTNEQVTQLPVELKRIEHGLGVCPVVIGARITLDGEFRGQFDQVVGLLEAHIRLFSLLLDYADQAVYSDIWVRDLIGELPYGGGAYIELGPNGAIGRVPPAVTSLDVQRDLAGLVDGIHLGGRWPSSRPGEISQSIASAKFLESSVGMMNTAIRTYHQIMQRVLSKAIRVAFLVDNKVLPGKKISRGILRNQEFLEEYDSSTDIDPDTMVRVDYGLGFGRDPGQSAVLHIQYSQAELISSETVQENIDGIRNVAEERSRIDREKFRGMALAKLLQGLEAGTVPNKALVEIYRARERGEDLIEIYNKYIVEPEEAMMEQAMPTGLGGQLGGMPMPPGPGQPPMAPPAPPGGLDLMARLNTPAGPGGTLGAQVMRQGA